LLPVAMTLRSAISLPLGRRLAAFLDYRAETGFTRSWAEDTLRRALRPTHLPQPRSNVRIGRYEVDFLFEEARVIVEVTAGGNRTDRRCSRTSLGQVRLAKYLAHAGVASRRASEELIRQGRVTVDGAPVTSPATDVSGTERIEVDGEPVNKEDRVVYMLNKPKGVVSTASDTHSRPTVVSLISSSKRLYPVGRLDADTTGLILLTNDGELANRLTHPRYEVPKTYVATVEGGEVKEGLLRQLREGIELEDGRTAPAKVRQRKPGTVELTIHEGRKRQVRRMLEEVGHPVRELRREALGPLRLGDLPEGEHRRLTPAEVERLWKNQRP
jgi:23S rRNA pseudouridine2605 synthase